MSLINYDAKETILEKVKEFKFPEEELKKRIEMRNEFVSLFTNEKIKKLTDQVNMVKFIPPLVSSK